MDNREHFCCCKDSVNFQITVIEVFALLYGLFIIVSLGYLDIEGFVEPIDFVFHCSAKCFDFRFREPVAMHIAFSLVFGQVFNLIGSLTNSSP